MVVVLGKSRRRLSSSFWNNSSRISRTSSGSSNNSSSSGSDCDVRVVVDAETKRNRVKRDDGLMLDPTGGEDGNGKSLSMSPSSSTLQTQSMESSNTTNTNDASMPTRCETNSSNGETVDYKTLYGYEEAGASSATVAPTTTAAGVFPHREKKPRRSSLKGSRSAHRRSKSSGCVGSGVDSDAATNDDTERTPRRRMKKRRSSITFAAESDNQVVEVESAVNMVDEPSQLWFQRDEYNRIQKKVNAIVEQAKRKEGIRDRKKHQQQKSCSCGDANMVLAQNACEKQKRNKYNINAAIVRRRRSSTTGSSTSGRSTSSTTRSCTRGLESLIDKERAKIHRQDAWVCVLEEQRAQQQHQHHVSDGDINGIKKSQLDDNCISQIYQFHTIDSQVQARERADQDIRAVEGYLKDTRDMLSRYHRARRMSC